MAGAASTAEASTAASAATSEPEPELLPAPTTPPDPPPPGDLPGATRGEKDTMIKQSIFGRIAQLAKANINAMIDAAEDPQL
ncbi:PspA/IM30 family protein, partial [Kocuria sp.]|uniref:PspA/IM30 family protein n=1 Tax=Kocuria sp. TaxID=1871328 RepID=UPI0035C259A2